MQVKIHLSPDIMEPTTSKNKSVFPNLCLSVGGLIIIHAYLQLYLQSVNEKLHFQCAGRSDKEVNTSHWRSRGISIMNPWHSQTPTRIQHRHMDPAWGLHSTDCEIQISAKHHLQDEDSLVHWLNVSTLHLLLCASRIIRDFIDLNPLIYYN